VAWRCKTGPHQSCLTPRAACKTRLDGCRNNCHRNAVGFLREIIGNSPFELGLG